MWKALPPYRVLVLRSAACHGAGHRSLSCSECSAAHPGNPETAKALQSFAKNPEAMRGANFSSGSGHCYNATTCYSSF